MGEIGRRCTLISADKDRKISVHLRHVPVA